MLFFRRIFIAVLYFPVFIFNNSFDRNRDLAHEIREICLIIVQYSNVTGFLSRLPKAEISASFVFQFELRDIQLCKLGVLTIALTSAHSVSDNQGRPDPEDPLLPINVILHFFRVSYSVFSVKSGGL